jgi:hypothetical protein
MADASVVRGGRGQSPKDGKHDETDTEAGLVRAADLIGRLELTIEGKQWIANLYSHVFTIEHQRRRLGPHVATKSGERVATRSRSCVVLRDGCDNKRVAEKIDSDPPSPRLILFPTLARRAIFWAVGKRRMPGIATRN